MDDSLVYPVLIALTFATALNLFLILRIARIVLPPEADVPIVPLVGQAAPAFEAALAGDGRPVPAGDFAAGPMALVFLSPGCPTCRSKIPELVEILPAALEAGVALWIVAADEVHDIMALTGSTPLAERTLVMAAEPRKALNPLGAAAIYIFIDEAAIVQAGGYLGDEDWLTFAGQMRAVAAGGHQGQSPVTVPGDCP